MEPNTMGNMQTPNPVTPEPVNAEQVVAEQVTVAQVEPVAAGSVVEEPEKPKKSHGMLIGLILCLLLAAGGVGFGVWAWMDGNTQKDALNSQIAELKKQNNELRDKVSSKPEVEEDVTVDVETDSRFRNPVIKSGTEDIMYVLGLQSSYILGQVANKRVDISIFNGEVSRCDIMEENSDGSWRVAENCSINGLNGNIYKAVEFGEGQENSGNMIGFIMENGQVAYFNLYDLALSNSVDIKGYLNINNYIVDAIEVGVNSSNGGGYGSTVFVLSDGSFVKYDATMLD